MTLSPAAQALDMAAACLLAVGVMLLFRLRRLPAASPAAYAVRIAGTMAFMLGLILIVFTTLFALSGAP